MYIVYILKSQKTSRFYIGHTKNVDIRLKRHNAGLVRSTKSEKPWKIVYQEHFKTKSAAYRRELKIKSYKGGAAFKKMLLSHG